MTAEWFSVRKGEQDNIQLRVKGLSEMAIFIQNYNDSKLYSADLFLKTSSLERQLRVPKSVFYNLKLKKPLLEGLFQRRVF